MKGREQPLTTSNSHKMPPTNQQGSQRLSQTSKVHKQPLTYQQGSQTASYNQQAQVRWQGQ
eukprot:scaffold310763_cov15-Tisochrysis_lutea.AAC.1